MEHFKNQSENKRVVIIGAGPAGLTAAYQLCKRGHKSIVLEKDLLVGGISRTVNYKNYFFDIGGHRFFTKIKAVAAMWKEVLGEDLLLRRRLSRIYYKKKFFHYPLRIMNTVKGLGVWNSFLILLSYIYAHAFPSANEESFELWVINRFGKRLYNTFFKEYTEKVWGLPCSEIRAEWAAQRIKGLSFMSVVKNALKFDKQKKSGKPEIKTLIEAFDYPKYGPGMMWQAVSEIITKNGSRVMLGSEAETILWDKDLKMVTAVEVGLNGRIEIISGTDFIISMPVQELVQKLRPSVPEEVLCAANNLKYRDFLTVALIVKNPDLFPDNWIYIHDADVKVGRIQNFKNWSPHMVPDPNKSCIGLEYFCYEGDDLWNMSDQHLIELGKREMDQLNIVQSSEVEDGCVIRMPKAYPSYDLKYRDNLDTIRYFLDGINNLQLVGRNGMHRYNNQDHSMLTAMLAVENIYGSRHDLWQVNEEQDYLEENKIFPDEGTIKTQKNKLGFAINLRNLLETLELVISIRIKRQSE